MADKKDPMRGYKHGKRDTGIIPELGLTEEKRDQLAKRDWSKPSDAAKNESSNWTTKECEEKRFSGIRVNKLNGMTEMWVVGQLRGTRRTRDIQNNPAVLSDLHEEVFKTAGTLTAVDLEVKKVRARSHNRYLRRDKRK